MTPHKMNGERPPERTGSFGVAMQPMSRSRRTVEEPEPASVFAAGGVQSTGQARVHAEYDRPGHERGSRLGAVESVGSPCPHGCFRAPTPARCGASSGRPGRRPSAAATSCTHGGSRSLPLSCSTAQHPWIAASRETGQVYAALIAGPGYLGGLRSISDPRAEAFYELGRPDRRFVGDMGPGIRPRARARGRQAGRGPSRPGIGFRGGSQPAAR